MDDYLALLADSALPLRPWFVPLTWALLFAVNARVVRRARQLNDSLTFATIGDRTALRRSLARASGALGGALILGSTSLGYLQGAQGQRHGLTTQTRSTESHGLVTPHFPP